MEKCPLSNFGQKCSQQGALVRKDKPCTHAFSVLRVGSGSEGKAMLASLPFRGEPPNLSMETCLLSHCLLPEPSTPVKLLREQRQDI